MDKRLLSFILNVVQLKPYEANQNLDNAGEKIQSLIHAWNITITVESQDGKNTQVIGTFDHHDERIAIIC